MSARRNDIAEAARRLPAIDFPVERHELSCGATLFVSAREGAPVTAVEVHLRGGPSLDPEGREGTAFLTGGLVDQGTTKHSEEELAALLEPAGGEVAGDAGGLHATIVSGEWKRLLGLVAEMLTSPTFPADKVRRQKELLLHRLAVERDDPRRQGSLRYRRLVYGQHWLGRAPYGTLESVQAIQPRHLRAHHRRNWVAGRARIAVCGDVDPAAVRSFLERALRGWERGAPIERRKAAFPKRGVRFDAFRAERQQVHVYLGHLGIRRRDPDYSALVVMDHVLGTGPGFTNRISRRLRDELGLAYAVHASIHSSAGLLPGLFTAYIGTSQDKLRVAVQGFLDEIRRIQDEPVPEDELGVAQSFLVGSFAMGFERASRRAAYLISKDVHGLPDDNLARLPREFAAVTPADVQRVARAHLHPDQCCLCAAGPVTRADLCAAL